MNILLVIPSQKVCYGRIKPPLQMHMGVAYLASYLEKESHNLEIIDIDAENIDNDSFAAIIKQKSYDVAGFSITTPTVLHAQELAELTKKHSPGTRVVLGGIHATIEHQALITHEYVDYVVRGEGEITFSELLRCLESGAEPRDVAGLVFKKDSEIIITEPRQPISDLDSLPFPARLKFKLNRYSYPDTLYRNTAPMMTSRGCPGVCSYCSAHHIFGRRFRSRSVGNIVDEIEFLTKTLKVQEIHIWDDNFITDRKRVVNIRDEIGRRGIRVKFAFPNGMRADFLDRNTLSALRDMGTYSIAIGVESGSQEILDKTKKGVKLEKVEEIFRLAKEMKLETWAFFMLGAPGETASTIRQTIDFAKKLDPDIAKFHILKPYPGTEVYNYFESKQLILSRDYDQYGIHTGPVHKLETLSDQEILEWQKKAYRSFFLRPSKILKEILRIKTFNRLVLNVSAGLSLLKIIVPGRR